MLRLLGLLVCCLLFGGLPTFRCCCLGDFGCRGGVLVFGGCLVLPLCLVILRVAICSFCALWFWFVIVAFVGFCMQCLWFDVLWTDLVFLFVLRSFGALLLLRFVCCSCFLGSVFHGLCVFYDFVCWIFLFFGSGWCYCDLHFVYAFN